MNQNGFKYIAQPLVPLKREPMTDLLSAKRLATDGYDLVYDLPGSDPAPGPLAVNDGSRYGDPAFNSQFSHCQDIADQLITENSVNNLRRLQS